MANGRNKLRRSDANRDEGRFVALPWAVLDCQAFAGLSYPARALLLEVARQFLGDNNGRLLCSRAHMAGRGWKSVDMLTKAKRELLEAGFLFETVKGRRPNRASWYSITWRPLNPHKGFDPGAMEGFKRGAYQAGDPLPLIQPKPSRDELFEKWRTTSPAQKSPPPVPSDGTEKNASLVPSHGTEAASIGPPHGTGETLSVPSHGPIPGVFAPLSVPPAGHHLDKPSIREASSGPGDAGEHAPAPRATPGKPAGGRRRSLATIASEKATERTSKARSKPRPVDPGDHQPSPAIEPTASKQRKVRGRHGPRDVGEPVPVPVLPGQLGLFGEAGPAPTA